VLIVGVARIVRRVREAVRQVDTDLVCVTLTVLETDRVKLTDIVRVARIVMTVREAVIQVVTDLVRVTLIVRDGVPVTHRLVVANREAGIVVRGV